MTKELLARIGVRFGSTLRHLALTFGWCTYMYLSACLAYLICCLYVWPPCMYM